MDIFIQVADSPTPTGSASRSTRIEALDGLRGLAALYVLYFHLGVLLKPVMDTMSAPWRILNRLTDHGHDAVVLFIVLSGFVLMLPVCRSRRTLHPIDYFRRRARRILRPYFAALILVLLAGLAWRLTIPQLFPASVRSGMTNPFVQDVTVGGILSHFLLLQNLKRSWVLMADSPMWSVATEWQIYFFFPFVLLPVWRRFGGFAAIAVALVLGMLPAVLAPHNMDIGTWCPWFLALFAFGMMAAELSVVPRVITFLNKPRFWGFAAFVAFSSIIAVEQMLPEYWNTLGLWCKDLLNGGATSLLLVYLARAHRNSPAGRPGLSQILESHHVLQLGTFSYSLYLIHLPVLQLVSVLVRNHMAGGPYVIAMFLLAPPAAIVCSIIFHMGFERPEFVECCTRMIRGWRPGPSVMWAGGGSVELADPYTAFAPPR